jgi:hypothetical protein
LHSKGSEDDNASLRKSFAYNASVGDGFMESRSLSVGSFGMIVAKYGRPPRVSRRGVASKDLQRLPRPDRHSQQADRSE